jgi:hypothetical protein
MGIDSFPYNLLLVVHVVSVVVGFGAVSLNGLYVSRTRQLTVEQRLAVGEVNGFASTKVAEIFVYVAAFIGFGVSGMSQKVYPVKAPWVLGSLVLWIVWVGLWHSIVRPGTRRMIEAQRSLAAEGGAVVPGDQRVALVEATCRKLVPAYAVLNVLVVAAVVLMVFKPGQ